MPAASRIHVAGVGVGGWGEVRGFPLTHQCVNVRACVKFYVVILHTAVPAVTSYVEGQGTKKFHHHVAVSAV